MVPEPLNQVPGPYEDTTCQMVMAYGRSDHPHLNVIREFRDELLESSRAGRVFVDYYYATAPFFVSMVSGSRFMKRLALYGFAYPSYLLSRFALGLTGR